MKRKLTGLVGLQAELYLSVLPPEADVANRAPRSGSSLNDT